jgi:hypothetical protein
MDERTADPVRPHDSDIQLVDVASGTPFPCGLSGSVILSSVPLGWRGIIVERHRREAQELQEHYVVGYGIAVSTGNHPIQNDPPSTHIALCWPFLRYTWRDDRFDQPHCFLAELQQA